MAQISVAQAEAFNNTLSDAFNVSYNQAVGAADNWSGRLAKTVSSPTLQVNLPFILQSMGVTESLIGEEPSYFTPDAYMQTVPLKKWGNGARIPIGEYENPMYIGMLQDDVNALATELAYYPVIKISDIMNNGDTSAYTVWDGQNYFSNSHVLPNGSAFDNLLSGNLTIPNLQAAIALLKTVKYGPYNRVLPTSGAKVTLHVAPSNEATARGFVFNTQLYLATFNTENTFASQPGKYSALVDDLIINPYLTDNGDWYLTISYNSYMPFIHLEHDKILRQFISRIAPENINVSDLDFYEWLVKSYEEVIPGQYFLACKSIHT